MKQRANAQLQKEADERIKAEKKKEISDQLFGEFRRLLTVLQFAI